MVLSERQKEVVRLVEECFSHVSGYGPPIPIDYVAIHGYATDKAANLSSKYYGYGVGRSVWATVKEGRALLQVSASRDYSDRQDPNNYYLQPAGPMRHLSIRARNLKNFSILEAEATFNLTTDKVNGKTLKSDAASLLIFVDTALETVSNHNYAEMFDELKGRPDVRIGCRDQNTTLVSLGPTKHGTKLKIRAPIPSSIEKEYRSGLKRDVLNILKAERAGLDRAVDVFAYGSA